MPTREKIDQSDDTAVVGLVMKNFGQDESAHHAFCQKVEERYKAYRGVLEIRSKAAGWTSRQHPPYVHQIVETMIASMIDPQPQWRVRPRPMLADPSEEALLRDGAQANEWLLNQQAACDRLGEKQVLFAKQCLITGLSVYKTFWNFVEEPGKRKVMDADPVYHPESGLPIGVAPRIADQSYTKVSSDDNTAEVVDVRDFIWHEAAVSLEKAKRVTHRILYSFEELKALERLGIYRNVDKLRETDDTSPDTGREQDLFEANRAKDMVEVLEQWRRTEDGTIRVTSVGNRNVLLRDKPNPFWHNEFPFVICSAVPDLFRIPGISEVELVQDLQEIAWTLLNQRLDSTALLNNAIVLIREDADDFEQFEWAPGAQWIVQDTEQVSVLPINPAPAELSLKAEELIKQDLQNIPGASPALLGQIDNSATTATEVSLTTSLGQRRLAAKKQQFKYCHARVGEQWMTNNQQFIHDDRLVAVVGRGGEQAFRRVSPLMIQGDYVIELEAMDESLLRQQRTAEAQARFQVVMASAPVFAAMAQQGVPLPNPKAYVDDVLQASGVTDVDRYWLAPAQPQQQAQLPAPGQTQQQGPPGLGVTAPQASDVNSPSNENTQSPAAAMARMLALGGGPANAPAG